MRIGLIGGTGFVGQHLSSALIEQNHQVFVFSRSALKMTFVSEHATLMRFNETSELELDLLINLAFPSDPAVLRSRKAVDRMFEEIESFIKVNKVGRFIHISSIALDPRILTKKNSGVYEYVKIRQEKKADKLRRFVDCTLIRIGNVVGIGSPWYEQILDSSFRNDIIALKGAKSNAVHVGQLAIHIGQNKFSHLPRTYNYAPLAGLDWTELLPQNMRELTIGAPRKTSALSKGKFNVVKFLTLPRNKFLLDFVLSKFNRTIYTIDKSKIPTPNNSVDLSNKKVSYSRVFYFANQVDTIEDPECDIYAKKVRSELEKLSSEIN